MKDPDDIEGVYMSGEVPEEGEADVDQEVGAAAGNEEDADGGDCGRWGVSEEVVELGARAKRLS